MKIFVSHSLHRSELSCSVMILRHLKCCALNSHVKMASCWLLCIVFSCVTSRFISLSRDYTVSTYLSYSLPSAWVTVTLSHCGEVVHCHPELTDSLLCQYGGQTAASPANHPCPLVVASLKSVNVVARGACVNPWMLPWMLHWMDRSFMSLLH